MTRDIASLRTTKFDVLVVGAGIHGAFIARAAANSDLKVGLIDKADIGSGTSHNSLKVLHGGVRYIQHLNIRRTVQSIREQVCFADTLHGRTRLVPFLMPTFGYGIRGPIAMWVGLQLYNFLVLLVCLQLKIPRPANRAHVVSRQKCKELAGCALEKGVTGGAIWYERQVEQADRAVLDIVLDAATRGCDVATRVSLSSLRTDDTGVVGANVKDELTGECFSIDARLLINATGPSAGELFECHGASLSLPQRVPVSKSMNLLVNKPAGDVAIGLQSPHDSDSVVGQTRRLYFLTPWKGLTLVGTSHSSKVITAGNLHYSESDVGEFIQDINRTFPELELNLQDVLYCYQGLTPLEASDQRKADSLHESLVVDHELTQGQAGIISVVGVKWTTARLVSESVMALIAKKLALPAISSTLRLPVPVHEYALTQLSTLVDSDIIKFCHVHMAQTMALRLADILLRRTDDFILGKLSNQQISLIVKTMADHLSWDNSAVDKEYAVLLTTALPEVRRQQLLACQRH